MRIVPPFRGQIGLLHGVLLRERVEACIRNIGGVDLGSLKNSSQEAQQVGSTGSAAAHTGRGIMQDIPEVSVVKIAVDCVRLACCACNCNLCTSYDSLFDTTCHTIPALECLIHRAAESARVLPL